ncbi:MAG: hypothetical protein WC564_02535 [Patescibacteria group bacterium]|jgi:23S rRNA (adenine2503-C2)-methyltransferase
MNISLNIRPVGKYVNDDGREGVRYAWALDGSDDVYVESGAFYKRTYLDTKSIDAGIAAYTTSVSLGCILSEGSKQCKFCVTGNLIPFRRLLTAEEIALQNVFMVLDDLEANRANKPREFAYMGQGEPGFSYSQVREAILITNSVMNSLGVEVYRHIFATSGVPSAIRSLTNDVARGVFGKTKILLHLSIHSAFNREQLMPIDQLYPVKDVISASEEYAKAINDKVVINLMMLKDAMLMGSGPFNTMSPVYALNLIKILNPKYHRVTLCEYNADGKVGTNNLITPEEVSALENIFVSNGFEFKKFVAFGKQHKLACGLLGGQAIPNIDPTKTDPILEKAIDLIKKQQL